MGRTHQVIGRSLTQEELLRLKIEIEQRRGERFILKYHQAKVNGFPHLMDKYQEKVSQVMSTIESLAAQLKAKRGEDPAHVNA